MNVTPMCIHSNRNKQRPKLDRCRGGQCSERQIAWLGKIHPLRQAEQAGLQYLTLPCKKELVLARSINEKH